MAEYGETSGQVYWKLPSLVPSWSVATVVTCTISKLLPDISSIAISFQAVVESVSPCQVIRHVDPALKTDPGPGSLGVTSASTIRGGAKARRPASTENATIARVEVFKITKERLWFK